MDDLKQALKAGGASAVTVTFTNPFDNAKTRLQLQNELVSKGQGEVIYTNVFQTVRKTFSDEGIRGFAACFVWFLLFFLSFGADLMLEQVFRKDCQQRMRTT